MVWVHDAAGLDRLRASMAAAAALTLETCASSKVAFVVHESCLIET